MLKSIQLAILLKKKKKKQYEEDDINKLIKIVQNDELLELFRRT